MDELQKILENGIRLKSSACYEGKDEAKGKKKKAKKRYINGAHNSGSAKKKAEIRKKRAERSAAKAAKHQK